MAAGRPEALKTLRQAIRTGHGYSEENSLPFGLPALDQRLGGGLARGALHEIAPAGAVHLGAASGFALSLAARAIRQPKPALLILLDFAAHEGGYFYGAGLDLFGLPASRLLILRAARARDALFAMEEALKCSALSCVIAELNNEASEADLTATRRLSLAARDQDGFGLLVRQRVSTMPSAAATRWTVAATAGPRDRFGGIGGTAFLLSLTKNRRGPCGEWTLVWNHHDGAFIRAANSVGVAAAATDRQDRAAHAAAR